MVLKIKQKVWSHLKQYLNCSQINIKSIKTKPFNHKNNQISDYKPELYIDLNDLDHHHINQNDLLNCLSKISFIKEINLKQISDENQSKPLIEFEIENYLYIKELINDLKSSDLKSSYGKNTLLSSGMNSPETMIVEFSSPNIAKPFHVGNYRSTIIGNFVANFLQFSGHNVIRLNYLGDFGTQFGILSLAFDYFGNDESLANDSLKHLYEVYVKGNTECKTSEKWRQSAKNRFNDLETKQNSNVLKQWMRFRELSVTQLKSLYYRLGIQFDEFHSESMYSKASIKIIDEMRQLGLIQTDETGAQFAILNTESNNCLKIPVIKSDGSTLYLTRDIAAALHRKQLYNFDKMFYIVDSSQSKHFNNLFKILNEFKTDFCHELTHLRFGRIIGMSTRKGEIIFLEDILNEAKERAIESCKNSPNTKISEDNFESVSDILGMSGLLINDLSHKRVADYKFNWERALRHTGDTGIALQYTHSRLCSLESNCGFDMDLNFEPKINVLNEFEANLLINLLSQFDDILCQSFEKLEPSLIVHYLFNLRNAINRALLVLKVKGQESDVAKTRLLLFYCARNVLNHSLKLLGVKPLKSM